MPRWPAWLVVATALALLAIRDWRVSSRADRRFEAQIREAAQRYGVDPALVKAVIWKESTFNPDARGRAGEIGLMQIREPAAIDWYTAERIRGFELEHLADPGTNIAAGAWYLSRLLRRYQEADDPVPYALADYNAGRTNVRKWIKAPGADTNSAVFLEQIDFPTTRRYIEMVMRRRARYRS